MALGFSTMYYRLTMAKTRFGQPIEVGKRYLFAELKGDIVRTVIEIIDNDAVRIDDFYKSSRWACNALYEI